MTRPLVKRAGDPAILAWKDQQLDRFFELGGLTTKQGRQFLVNLEKDFSDRHLSLGGGGRPPDCHHLFGQCDGRG